MTKAQFIAQLGARIAHLPQEDVVRSLEYYNEMIEDRMEEGLCEQDAVAAMGEPDAIAREILSAIPLPHLIRAKMRPKRRLRGGEIALIALGSPLWLSLLLVLFSVILAVYVTIWSVAVSFYAVDFSLAIATLGGTLVSAKYFLEPNAAAGLLLLGCALLCAGAAILLFFSLNKVTAIVFRWSKTFLLWLKTCIVGKGASA